MGFGPPSNTIVAVPIAAANNPTVLETKVLDQLRALHVASPNMLAWIQSVAPAEPITGHVKFGEDPNRIKDLKTEGPSVLLQMGDIDEQAEDEQNTFSGTVSCLARYLWFEDKDAADTHIAQQNFILKIKDEIFKTVPFHPTEGGEVQGVSGIMVQLLDSSGKRFVADLEYTISFGVDT